MDAEDGLFWAYSLEHQDGVMAFTSGAKRFTLDMIVTGNALSQPERLGRKLMN